MAKIQFKGQLSNGKMGVTVDVTVYLWEEDGMCFVYSPALDLTGYGSTERNAKESFKIVLQEYITYTSNKKTLFDDLEQHGWLVNRKKKRVHAPDFEDMFSENKEFKNILSNKATKREITEVELSLV